MGEERRAGFGKELRKMEYCRSLYSKRLVRPMKYSGADMGCLGLRLSLHPCGLWYGRRLALRRTDHYSPSQREQRAAPGVVCDDERLLSSPTPPLLFIAGLTGGCPQEPTARRSPLPACACLRWTPRRPAGTARQRAGWKRFCSRAHQPSPVKSTPRACSHQSRP